MQKVTITGYVKLNRVLKKVKRTEKHAELWPCVPYNSVSQPFSTLNYDKKAPVGFVRKESFNTSSVMKKVKRTGKHAELWPYVPYSSVTQLFSTHNYDKKAPVGFVRKESFNTSSVSNR